MGVMKPIKCAIVISFHTFSKKRHITDCENFESLNADNFYYMSGGKNAGFLHSKSCEKKQNRYHLVHVSLFTISAEACIFVSLIALMNAVAANSMKNPCSVSLIVDLRKILLCVTHLIITDLRINIYIISIFLIINKFLFFDLLILIG